ncbi:hypothetical protein [Terrimonas ferruginea]|uniref:hypothetical protein n=1 Tax=Terrimonas ferruginea TaxID=249 RepID=UPI00040CFA93|nr:hypothetical protein [Terrimonas ferruginea]
MRCFLFAAFCCLLTTQLCAQQFGGTPSSVKWRQIETDTARIIYPEGLDSQAVRVAGIVHHLAAKQPYALGSQMRRINIVLQNNTVIANGYVGLGPYRSEFYLTPERDNFDQGSIPWTDQLSLHEYRHVEQFNNFNNGLSRVARGVFGEEGYSVAISAAVPDWFFEGDAVYNETRLSRQGRGRLPLFLNAYPALWKADKKYSWMKLRNGSLKDYVPTHYNLGYLLVQYGREKYGSDVWANVTRDASAYKGLFYPFQRAVKKYTGLKYADFYNNAFQHFKEKLPPAPATEATAVVKQDGRVVNNDRFPFMIGQDSVLFLRTSYNKRPAFMLKDASGIHRLRVRDIALDDQYACRNGKVVYAAYESDPRWRWRDYSVIKIWDIKAKKERTLRHRTKYFVPDISPEGDRIVAVQQDPGGRSALHVLDAGDGKVLKEITSDEINVFSDPKFAGNDRVITAVRLRDGRMALAEADINAGSIVRLTSPSYHAIGNPWVTDTAVYYTASYEGSDQVYAYRFADRKIFRVLRSPLGSYQVNADKGKFVWSTFTADGYQLLQTDSSRLAWVEVSDRIFAEGKSQPADTLAGLLGQLPTRFFPDKKYRKSTRLFNFHSWRPYYEDPLLTYSLYGNNILNTTETEIYYQYNENDKTHAAGASFVYGAFFPYLSAGAQYTFDRSVRYSDTLSRNWDQVDLRVGLNVPLTWAKGKTVRQFNIGSNYFYRSDYNKGANKDRFDNFQFSYLHHFFSWGQQTEMARQHIFPRLGYNVNANYRHAITNYKSWQSLFGAAVYLPGAAYSHSLVFTGAFQESDTVNALFSSRFPYSRGYNAIYAARMWRASANYHFPLWYPDWGFANIAYIQRIRANAFYDLTRVYSRDKQFTVDQRSTGGEIYFDTKWWNQYSLTFGFRVSYLLDTDFYEPRKAVSYEFVLPVSIIPR